MLCFWSHLLHLHNLFGTLFTHTFRLSPFSPQKGSSVHSWLLSGPGWVQRRHLPEPLDWLEGARWPRRDGSYPGFSPVRDARAPPGRTVERLRRGEGRNSAGGLGFLRGEHECAFQRSTRTSNQTHPEGGKHQAEGDFEGLNAASCLTGGRCSLVRFHKAVTCSRWSRRHCLRSVILRCRGCEGSRVDELSALDRRRQSVGPASERSLTPHPRHGLQSRRKSAQTPSRDADRVLASAASPAGARSGSR